MLRFKIDVDGFITLLEEFSQQLGGWRTMGLVAFDVISRLRTICQPKVVLGRGAAKPKGKVMIICAVM